MRRLKKILKISGITLAILIGLLFIIPIVFKKQVQALVKKEINKQLNATVDFKDVKLSLLRHFPKATISIKGLTIVGKGEFAKDTLIAAEKLEATAGLFSVLKGKDIKIYGLYAYQPRIHLLMNAFGRANWDIAKPSTSGITDKADTSASSFKMQLKKYQLSNAFLIYDDKQANTYMEINDLNHSGSGNFTSEVFTLHTSTKARSFDLVQDGIPYLNHTQTTMNADVQIDTKTQTYTFNTDDIHLNAMQLTAKGFVQMINAQTIKMDIQFGSPQNDFKNILSMVPAMFTKDFKKVKTGGKASFAGFVKGTYTPAQLPSYDVKLLVQNGFFQYPDLPKPVQNINLDLHAYNKDGQPDNSVVNISKGHLELDKEPFDFHFNYSQPVSAQYIDADAKGKLDLTQLKSFLPLEKDTKLSGQVWADAYAKGPLQSLQQMSGPFTAGGFFNVSNLFYSDKNLPQPIKNGNIKATLQNSGGVADNTTIDISAAHIEIGNDPVDFSLKLTKPVTTMNFDGHAKGRLTLGNLKQFGMLPNGTTLSGLLQADAGFAGSQAAISKGEYDQINMNGNALLSNVAYQSSTTQEALKIPNAKISFNNKLITLENTTASYIGSQLTANGSLSNLIGYMAGKQSLGGNLNLNADQIDLNKWMGTTASNTTSTNTTTASTSTATTAPFAVPANMNLNIHTTANTLVYDKVNYSNISGTLHLADEKIELQNIKANALDGSLLINGSYATRVNKEKPDISLTYDIKDMDVQKTFYAFNTMQSLMPIGKFLAGKLSSQLSLTGNLKQDMFPLLNSLTGKGNLLLLKGVLAKFAPLEKIASVLDVDRLQSISLKDIKNYIEFSNGKVLVKPFTVKVDDIEMEIAGLHGFDQSIDYGIKMKLPRAYMGSKGNTLVNNLISSANAKGIPIKMSDIINLSLKLTGTISSPSLSVNLKDVAGDVLADIKNQAEDFAKAKADSLKQKAKDSLNVIKSKAEQKAKEALAEKGIDTANLNIKNAKDTIVKRVTDTLKKKAKDSLKSKIKKLFN